MSTRGRLPQIIGAVAVALLIGFLGKWLQEGPTSIGRSDFTPEYVGATILRDGQGGQLYDEALQAQLHSRAIAPDRVGNLAFEGLPGEAALAVPVSLLSLDAAYRIWGLLQLALLIAAVLVVVRAAPWPVEDSRRWKVAAALAGVASVSTLVLLIEGQRSGVDALGLALAYHEWQAGRLARGGAVLGLLIGLVKPQLAIGFIGFVLGWRDRRLIAGAVAGAAASVAIDLCLVGTGGIGAFVSIVGATSSVGTRPIYYASIPGIAGILFGNGAIDHGVVVGGIVVAFAIAALVGGALRRKRCSLELGCAAAAVLTLLAAPEAFMYDLALLSPAFVWLLAAGLSRAAAVPSRLGLPVAVVLGGWLALSLAMFVCLVPATNNGGSPATGAVVPEVLIACAALLVTAVFRGTPPEPAAGSSREGTAGLG